MLRALALVLTVFTGVSGLVYEVAWQKYLATLLGSHSEATAAVLGLYLAGLSIGYSVFGFVSKRVVEHGERYGKLPMLLFTYGAAEAAIGIYALAFPTFFGWVGSLSQAVSFDSIAAAFAFDVFLSALLVLPPTILMGGTIPMLTQSLSRDANDATRLHALVYAFNTAGAFCGALLAGFLLIPWLGLANVMYATAAINLIAGVVFIIAGRSGNPVAMPPESEGAPKVAGFAQYCLVSLLSGFAMMSLQTVFIRIGGLSFGSSEYTFAMVVSVFVLCIALGSFAVSSLSRIPDWLLAGNQWLFAGALLAIYTQLDKAPYWIHLLRTQFGNGDGDFYAYHLAGGAAFIALAGIPLACSGATLPLLFHHMRREVNDLGSLAGHIYSWNTTGSLLGALSGGYALLFWLDLDDVFRLAVCTLVISAAILTARTGYFRSWIQAASAICLALAFVVGTDGWRPELLSTGLFRDREHFAFTDSGAEIAASRLGGEIVFYDDDPTMSVTVREQKLSGGRLSRQLMTNGKGDGGTKIDYGTMALAGLIPALHVDSVRTSFVIGLGTGVTAGELANLPAAERVVVAEISPGVIDAAPLFDFANFGISKDPRVELTRGDAYRTLLRTDDRYDVIVSEPSNPWVTGVEMLFSREFLIAARERLSSGGVYAQWYHQYETNNEVLELVLRTYAQVFEHVAVWYGWKSDLLILGFADDYEPPTLEQLEKRFARPHMVTALKRSRIDSFLELVSHELIPYGVVSKLGLEGPIHELYHPRLSHLAGRAFFSNGEAELPFSAFGEAARLGNESTLLSQFVSRRGTSLSEAERNAVTMEACSERFLQCSTYIAAWYADDPTSPLLRRIIQQTSMAGFIFGSGLRENPYKELARLFDNKLPIPAATLTRSTELFTRYYQHTMPFSHDKLLTAWQRCNETISNVEDCDAARESVHKRLGRTQADE